MSVDFVKVAEIKDIQPSNMLAVDLEGERVCIANVEGNYYAIGNICIYLGGLLNEGINLKDSMLSVLGMVLSLMLGQVSQPGLLPGKQFQPMK